MAVCLPLVCCPCALAGCPPLVFRMFDGGLSTACVLFVCIRDVPAALFLFLLYS